MRARSSAVGPSAHQRRDAAAAHADVDASADAEPSAAGARSDGSPPGPRLPRRSIAGGPLGPPEPGAPSTDSTLPWRSAPTSVAAAGGGAESGRSNLAAISPSATMSCQSTARSTSCTHTAP